MTKDTLEKIGIVTKSGIEEAHGDLVRKLTQTLTKKYHKQVRFDTYSAACVGEKECEKKSLMRWADLIITLGGDGTILKTAREIEKRKVLILGVNVGTRGFLTELPPLKLFTSLKRIFQNQYMLDQRFLLRVTVYRKKKKIMTSLALNDAVISQGGFARLIRLRTTINQRKLHVFRADGLIISTPTGSTGHALSAGGPIVHPKVPAFVIVPICPATLANRPIVIPNDRQIKVVLETHRREEMLSKIGLTLDGQVAFPLEFEDIVKVRTSARKFHLMRLTGGNYYKMLRSKLSWGMGV